MTATAAPPQNEISGPTGDPPDLTYVRTLTFRHWNSAPSGTDDETRLIELDAELYDTVRERLSSDGDVVPASDLFTSAASRS